MGFLHQKVDMYAWEVGIFCKPHFLNITISSLLQEQNLEKVLIMWQAANMCQTTNECVTYYEKSY